MDYKILTAAEIAVITNNKEAFVGGTTDKYFTKTRKIVEHFGESIVTIGVFQRCEVMAATELAIKFIKDFCPEAEVTAHFEDGDIVPALSKSLTIRAPFSKIVELETTYLQVFGFTQVCAITAYRQIMQVPTIPLLDMHGRHSTGPEMMIQAAYGASVASKRAQKEGAKGFVATSNDLTAHFYGDTQGRGTQPHALIGYAKTKFPDAKNATLQTMKMYVEVFPEEQSVTSLVDYDGREITDSLEIAEWFYNDPAQAGKTWGVRLDTHGGRYAEGLDYETSVDIVAKWLNITGDDGRMTRETQIMKIALQGVEDGSQDAGNYFNVSDETYNKVWKMMIGKGVSAANVINQRNAFDGGGYTEAQIVASSGFNVLKCQVMANINAPIDVIGTGSFLPASMSETYGTADVYMYDDVESIKVGREFLFDSTTEEE